MVHSTGIVNKMAAIIVLVTCVTSSSMAQISKGRDKDSPNTIEFLMLNIKTPDSRKAPVITITDQRRTPGTLKRVYDEGDNFKNYLTLYLYSGGVAIDSIKIEHPFYKHIEYPVDEETLATKDTLLDNADFFIRFQASKTVDKMRFVETIAGAGSRELTLKNR